jgi:hypothetical protein
MLPVSGHHCYLEAPDHFNAAHIRALETVARSLGYIGGLKVEGMVAGSISSHSASSPVASPRAARIATMGPAGHVASKLAYGHTGLHPEDAEYVLLDPAAS